MQTAAVFVALLAAASASSVAFRVPQADSAVINSQRQGGNFAYSTQETQAYGVVSPVAATYAVQQPITYTTGVQQPIVYTAGVQQPIVQQQVVAVQKPVEQQLTYTSAVQQPITYTTAVQQPIQQVVSVQKPVEQQLTYTVQPQVQNLNLQNVPVAQTYVASAPAWNQWYGNSIAPVQYAVVDAKKVETVEKPVQYGYSIQQGGAAVVSTPFVGSQVVAPVTYTAATSVVEKGTPADTYKTVAGVSPLGFNNVYGYGVGQPWTGYQVVV